jgi:hypothetical protein
MKPSSADSQHLYLKNSCDIEHYYKYRMSKHSFKDYASAPYYQYSSSNNKSSDKQINTDENESKIKNDEHKNTKNNKSNEKKYVSKSTSTDLECFSIDSFSKSDLLSSNTLYNNINNNNNQESNNNNNNNTSKKSVKEADNYKRLSKSKPTLNEFETSVYSTGKKDGYSCTYKQEYHLNVSDDELKLKKKLRGRKEYEEEDEDEDEDEDNDAVNSMYTNSKNTKTKTKDLNKNKNSSHSTWVFRISNCFDSEEDYKKFALIKAGPKKSSEWSIFKNQNSKTKQNFDDDEDNDINRVF